MSSTTSTTFSCNVFLPPKLQLRSGNLSKEWKQWHQIWDAYEEVTYLRNKTSRLRVATFITCIGKEALEVHNGLPFQSEDQKTDISKVLATTAQLKDMAQGQTIKDEANAVYQKEDWRAENPERQRGRF